MRLSFALVMLLPSISVAQTEEVVKAVERKLATLKYVASLEHPHGGFYVTPQDPNVDAAPRPSLRATNGAVRAWKYLGGDKFPNKETHAAFVLSCYDPQTGGFAEPGGKPDVTITSIGVMAAAELGIPHDKYAKAMGYLKANAKTFEEVRIGAAAVEAWGVKDCPFDLKPWFKIGGKYIGGLFEEVDKESNTGVDAKVWAKDGGSRNFGSVTAMYMRLGESPFGPQTAEEPKPKSKPDPKAPAKPNLIPDSKFDFSDLPSSISKDVLVTGQREDGGWGKKGEKASDIETTYRVMRALMLLKEKPKDVKKLRAFVEAHRNKDGGYATKPGDKSSMSGVYYCAIVSKWLDDMEAKK